jgi:hypothetical protein
MSGLYYFLAKEMEVVENLNGKKGSVVTQPADGNIMNNNSRSHITIAVVGVGKVVNSVNKKLGDILLSSEGSTSAVDSENSHELSLTTNGATISSI